ncbi:hypothetical protein D9M72_288120 [compost metagenome]
MHSSTGTRAVRQTSAIGSLAVLRCACTCANSGDSFTPSRIATPTSSSAALARNGRRQPQSMNTSCSIDVTARKASSDRIRPAGLPSCANEAKKVRRPLGACSPAISTAPPHSPPTAMPCTTRSSTSSTGAMAPAVA